MSVVFYIAAGVGAAFVGHYADRRQPWWAQWWYGTWMVICVVFAALNAAQHDWPPSGLMAACAVLNGFSWWRHRKNRKRKRAASLAGAKSRARIAALVRKVRETVQPRRVLRPAPGRSS